MNRRRFFAALAAAPLIPVTAQAKVSDQPGAYPGTFSIVGTLGTEQPKTITINNVINVPTRSELADSLLFQKQMEEIIYDVYHGFGVSLAAPANASKPRSDKWLLRRRKKALRLLPQRILSE